MDNGFVNEISSKLEPVIAEPNRPPIIAIDWDGTIVEDKAPLMGKVYPASFLFIKTLQHYGWYVGLYTCRYDETLNVALQIAKEHDVVFDFVNENHSCVPFKTSNKIYADFYIDDKSGFDGSSQYGDLFNFLTQTKFPKGAPAFR